MNETLVQDAQHDVNGHQRGENQQGLVRKRVLERGRRALEIRLQTRRHVHVLLYLVDCSDGASQGGIGREIERDRDGWKLSLMIDRERLGCALDMCKCTEGHGVAHRCATDGVRRRVRRRSS